MGVWRDERVGVSGERDIVKINYIVLIIIVTRLGLMIKINGKNDHGFHGLHRLNNYVILDFVIVVFSLTFSLGGNYQVLL